MAEGELSPAREQHYREELKTLHTEVEEHKSDGIITEEEKEKTKTELSKLLRSIQEELGPNSNHDLYGQITGLAQSVAEFRKKQKTEKTPPPVPKQTNAVPSPVQPTKKPPRLPITEKPPVVTQKPAEEKTKIAPSISEIIEKNTRGDFLDLRRSEATQTLQILDFLKKAKSIP